MDLTSVDIKDYSEPFIIKHIDKILKVIKKDRIICILREGTSDLVIMDSDLLKEILEESGHEYTE